MTEQQSIIHESEGSPSYFEVLMADTVRRGYLAQITRSKSRTICGRFLRRGEEQVTEWSPPHPGESTSRMVHSTPGCCGIIDYGSRVHRRLRRSKGYSLDATTAAGIEGQNRDTNLKDRQRGSLQPLQNSQSPTPQQAYPAPLPLPAAACLEQSSDGCNDPWEGESGRPSNETRPHEFDQSMEGDMDGIEWEVRYKRKPR